MDYFKNDSWYPNGYQPSLKQEILWRWTKQHILNPLRIYKGKPIIVTDFIRVPEDYKRLLVLGYHPSPVSDHFAGNEVFINPNDRRYESHGPSFSYSTFAVDITGHFDLKQLFEDIYFNLVFGSPSIQGINSCIGDSGPFRQLIYEVQDIAGVKKEWLHISIPFNVCFGKAECEELEKKFHKEPFLTCINGKYSIYHGE